MIGRIQRETFTARVPVIGKLKIGEKRISSKTGSEYPASLDHFKPEGIYASKFTDAFGEAPQNIEILFITDDVHEACNERYELRDGKKLFAYGDGTTFFVWDNAKKQYIERTKTEDEELLRELPKQLKSKWEAVLTLRFIIPRIRGVAGVWELTTKGKDSSIPAIVGAFDMVMGMAGTVRNIPFDLSIRIHTSQKPGEASKYPVLQIVPNISTENMESIAKLLASDKESIARLGVITEAKLLALGAAKEELK